MIWSGTEFARKIIKYLRNNYSQISLLNVYCLFKFFWLAGLGKGKWLGNTFGPEIMFIPPTVQLVSVVFLTSLLYLKS